MAVTVPSAAAASEPAATATVEPGGGFGRNVWRDNNGGICRLPRVARRGVAALPARQVAVPTAECLAARVEKLPHWHDVPRLAILPRVGDRAGGVGSARAAGMIGLEPI